MKRIIIITLALLCAISLMSCKQDPGDSGSTTPAAPVQTVKINDGWEFGAAMWAATADTIYQWGRGSYDLSYDPPKYIESFRLKVWSYDHMTNTWPETPVTYTGTCTAVQYDKVITDTPTYKEITKTWMYTVDVTAVDDPMYEPTMNVYDGMFDIRYVSNYGNVKTKSGGYSARYNGVDGTTTFALEVTTNVEGAPSALIGISGWKHGGAVVPGVTD